MRSAASARPLPYARQTSGKPVWCWPTDLCRQRALSAEWHQRVGSGGGDDSL